MTITLLEKYEIGRVVYSVWSAAWTAYRDDLKDMKIDNLANHFGNFDTEKEAMDFLRTVPLEKDYKTKQPMETLFVIEKRSLIFSVMREP